MIQVIESCQFEWDIARGVLYVHNKDTGCTVLRICGLRRQLDNEVVIGEGQMIDVTQPERVTYPQCQ